ncbi:2-oxoglutarate receptor 1-like [Epinephelus moara]|uniref:2-oxoglutarate receptor 1-like n=1 Tax=Epinephelus moara TaxID=300413 RepID=UPI00214EFD68|nr:2-oxoglutarate receptor 1-like [Epinephelus moara]XP_049919346.1 2-oxoglutarate receptor 1-like [Epinephelus moara]XP_049919347.1 2-oxoglutarate receptor 1-like [Epinephelus moara]
MASILYYGELHNCTDVDQLMKRYYLPVSYGVIFIVGLVGNVTSLGIYLTKLRPWTSSSIIMVNLALTDLLYVLSMPFLIYYYSNGDSWTLGDFMCRFVRFGFHFNLYGSILFLMCHAVFRYMVVIKPLRSAQVQQKSWGIIACSAVWVIAAAEITPMLTMISLEKRNNKTYCLDFASTIPVDDVRWYGWLLTAIGFLLPLVVVFMCYIGVVKQLVKGPSSTSPCRMRARRVTVLILVVFVVCFLPYHILRVLRIETRKIPETPCMVERIVHAAYIISRPLAGLNTFFNLALYTLSGDKFRRAFLSTFYWENFTWLTKARSLLHLAIISKTGHDMPAV